MTWPLVPLGEIAHQIRGVSFSKADSESIETIGYLPILTASNVTDDGIVMAPLQYVPSAMVDDKQMLRKSDILVTASSGSLSVVGRAALVKSDLSAGFGAFCKVMRPGGRVDATYMAHFMRTPAYRREVSRLAAGANINNLRNEDLDSLVMPLPPLPEQRRIASILDQADRQRLSARSELKLREELEESLFRDIVGHPAVGRSLWPRLRIDSFAKTRLGKMLDGAKQTGVSAKRYLRNANVQWGRIDLSDLLSMDFDEADQREFALRNGDVLVCEGGQPGRSAIWNSEPAEVFFQKALHRVRLDTNVMLPEVFLWSMRLLVVGGHLADVVSSATIAHLTGEKLKSLELPVPPMEKQRQFLELAKLNRHAVVSSQARAEVFDELFAALEHRAFRGQL